MLDGIREDAIVVGAYTDGHGGICPMLAAHRHGGRTSFVSFARAWDAFARSKRVRPASVRELRTLEHLLEASLAEGTADLGAAIAEHAAASARSADAVDQAQQVQGGEGLGQEEIRARRMSAPLRGVVGVAGEHDDRRAGRRRVRA